MRGNSRRLASSLKGYTKMWVFLHIPKTAGVAVREILSSKFCKNEIVHVEDPIRFSADSQLHEDTKLIHGHFDISFSKKLPDVESRIFTFLRDPLERSISEYYFVKKGSYDLSILPQEQVQVLNKIQDLTLEEYLLSQEAGIRGRVQNNQLFYLSGDVFNADPSLEQRYETACRNLDNFKYVGIVEEMEKSLQLLSFKTNSLPANSVIRNSTERSSYNIAQEVIDEFKKRNVYEYMTYEYAKQKMLSSYEDAFREMLRDKFIASLEKLPPKQELHYTFDQPLAGDGWHTREGDTTTYWRFTGPSSTSSLYFGKIAAEQRTISLYVFHAITPEHLDSLQVSYNGFPLSAPERIDNEFKYSIPEQAISAKNYTHLEITTIAPCKPAEMDNRLLGIAFSAITIT